MDKSEKWTLFLAVWFEGFATDSFLGFTHCLDSVLVIDDVI